MVIFHSYVKLPEGTLHSPESKHPAGSGQNERLWKKGAAHWQTDLQQDTMQGMEYGSLQSRCLHISSALLAFMHWDLQKREQDLCSIEPYRAISWFFEHWLIMTTAILFPAMLAACESILNHWILKNFAVLRLTKCGFADALLALARHGNAGNSVAAPWTSGGSPTYLATDYSSPGEVPVLWLSPSL